MRPIQRPIYTGTLYKTYKSYLDSLLKAYGPYCSYCERLDKLDVEHVAPKSKNSTLELEWSNLLLGCARCNRDFKGSKNDNRLGYLWPDSDNTFKALIYSQNGRVTPSANSGTEAYMKAQTLIDLVKLDDFDELQKPLSLGRRIAFKMAQRSKGAYLAGDELLEEVMDEARAGFWSVWVTVFSDVPDIYNALQNCAEYPNTALNRAYSP